MEYEGLIGLQICFVHRFFDGEQSVMVMNDDKRIRTNRLNLLAVLRNQASILANFDQIIGR